MLYSNSLAPDLFSRPGACWKLDSGRIISGYTPSRSWPAGLKARRKPEKFLTVFVINTTQAGISRRGVLLTVGVCETLYICPHYSISNRTRQRFHVIQIRQRALYNLSQYSQPLILDLFHECLGIM